MKLIGDLAADLMGEVFDALRPLYVLFFCETQSFFLQSSADVESSIIQILQHGLDGGQDSSLLGENQSPVQAQLSTCCLLRCAHSLPDLLTQLFRRISKGRNLVMSKKLHEGTLGVSSDFCGLAKRHFANFIEFDGEQSFCLISRKT